MLDQAKGATAPALPGIALHGVHVRVPLGLTLAWLYWNAQGTESSVRYGAGRMRKLFAFPFLLLTNQYVLLLAYVYWPTHIYLFKEQGQTPSATVAMMRPPATLQP